MDTPIIKATKIKFSADLPLCECCEEPFCPDCNLHFGDCPCPGPSSELEDNELMLDDTQEIISLDTSAMTGLSLNARFWHVAKWIVGRRMVGSREAKLVMDWAKGIIKSDLEKELNPKIGLKP